MTVTKLNEADSDSKRQISELKFPYYALADSVAVAQTIHSKGGGKATLDELAAHLGYAGTNNGAFKSRIAASRLFGLVEKAGSSFTITQTAQGILMPVYDWAPKENLVKAFLNVALFRQVFEEYKGKALPPEFGMKNALKTIFKVTPTVVERAYRVLMESAETAGFFETRAGARTHLIIPTITKGAATPPADAETPPAFGGGNSGGNGGGTDTQGDKIQTPTTIKVEAGSLSNVKARYVESLIKLFEAKAEKGELDEALMSRIEKLLER
jgi:hypothetical protein